jgi:hypothetical protein
MDFTNKDLTTVLFLSTPDRVIGVSKHPLCVTQEQSFDLGSEDHVEVQLHQSVSINQRILVEKTLR